MRLRTLALLTVSSAGFMLAGYMGLFEVLIELTICSWTFMKVWDSVPDRSRLLSPRWVWTLRRRVTRYLLKRQSFRASTVVVLVGVVGGWFLTLGWLLIRDPGFVLAREIKETILDIIIFVPLVLIMAMSLSAVEAFEDPEGPVTDPRDPEYFDIMAQYALGQAEAAAPFGRLASKVSAAAPFVVIGLWGFGLFFIGCAIHARIPHSMLEAARNWSIPL